MATTRTKEKMFMRNDTSPDSIANDKIVPGFRVNTADKDLDDIKFSEIQSSIPKEYFQVSTLKSLKYFFIDVFMIVILFFIGLLLITACDMVDDSSLELVVLLGVAIARFIFLFTVGIGT